MVRKSKKSVFKQDVYQTENPWVKCTRLPDFIRAKMYLGAVFYVYFANNVVLDGVEVVIRAGNSYNSNAELKNNHSVVRNGVAEFKDLRFVGTSGRGKKLNVYIVVKTSPEQVIVYANAIKVTVDGPRPPRSIKNKSDQTLELPESPASLVLYAPDSNEDGSSSSSCCKQQQQQQQQHPVRRKNRNKHAAAHTTNAKMASIQRAMMSSLPYKKRFKFVLEDNNEEPTTYQYVVHNHHYQQRESGASADSSDEAFSSSSSQPGTPASMFSSSSSSASNLSPCGSPMPPQSSTSSMVAAVLAAMAHGPGGQQHHDVRGATSLIIEAARSLSLVDFPDLSYLMYYSSRQGQQQLPL